MKYRRLKAHIKLYQSVLALLDEDVDAQNVYQYWDEPAEDEE